MLTKYTKVHDGILNIHILPYTGFVWEKIEKRVSKYFTVYKEIVIYFHILFRRFFLLGISLLLELKKMLGRSLTPSLKLILFTACDFLFTKWFL